MKKVFVLAILVTLFACISVNAAEPTDPAGQFLLAQKYEKGNGIPKDLARAFHWYEKSAKQGFPPAQFETALFHDLGKAGMKKDYIAAAYWYGKAAEQGEVNSQYNLGGLLWEGGFGLERDREKAMDWWFLAALQGHAGSQHNLGYAYALRGKQDPEQFKKAYYWYHQAADQRSPKDLWHLGVFCENGLGVEKDIGSAIYWYRKAAAKGHPEARERLKKLGY